ncbi:aminotransferase class I/II-fold pyridoxal phosphate-dependent enzyme [Georgenia sp. MJ173]|uniref:DegT/DnrJ/EryC1/StrS family aminotransferase n=1 Tax=Georgenia sunbinii TaxID=3117728 RepID=UPI002F26BFC1
MNDRILLSPPDTGPAEEEAVLRAMRSGWIAPLGPEVDAFEAEIAQYTGRQHAVALASGTAALHLALLNMGVGPGDYVVTATMTFAATANAITYTGARPVFVDCDDTGNIDVSLLEHALDDLESQGKHVAAILPVDLLGKVADYYAIGHLAQRAGIPVLADAAESLGATRNGAPAGSFGDAAAISFNGNKIMTTSGGGMLLTDNSDFADRARYLATQARQPVAHYEHTDVGYNYRLSNILAAIGRAQLDRLDAMIDRRRQHRLRYCEAIADIPGATVFGRPDGAESPGPTRDNFWLTSVIIDPETAGWTAQDLIAHFGAHNIEARPLWKPMHLQPIYRDSLNYSTGVAERIYRTGVSLPSGSIMTDRQLERISNVLNDFESIHAKNSTNPSTLSGQDAP